MRYVPLLAVLSAGALLWILFGGSRDALQRFVAVAVNGFRLDQPGDELTSFAQFV